MGKNVDARIELRRSKIKGVGVFAVRRIAKGEKIADGISEEDYKERISWNSLKKYGNAVRKKIMDFCIGTPDGFIPPEGLDFNRLSTEWYINHSCNGNVGFDENGDFVAIRPIPRGTELTYDYGLAESNPRFRMKCKCGRRNCRGVVTGNDWTDRTFRRSHLGFMLPALKPEVILSLRTRRHPKDGAEQHRQKKKI